MLIESKIKIGHDNMFDIYQANFKSAHLLDKMALVQFQRNRSVNMFAVHLIIHFQGLMIAFISRVLQTLNILPRM